MEREMNPRQRAESSANPPPEGDDLDPGAGNLEALRNVADEILSSIDHSDAEEYLQQSRQSGGQ